MEQFIISSPLGNLELVFDDAALVAINLSSKEPTPMISKNAHTTQQQLNEYFAGTRTYFDIPYRIVHGTTLQKNVWKALLAIPFGSVVTYATIAKSVGNPGAVRAVGSAIGKNPLPVLIPCHRVIASNGDLGGFGWGLPRKKKLLELEQHQKPTKRTIFLRTGMTSLS